jgi:hypothetical protein
VYLDFDVNGKPVMSDGAFRTKELSVRRCDKVSEAEMLKEGNPTDGLAQIHLARAAIRRTDRSMKPACA